MKAISEILLVSAAFFGVGSALAADDNGTAPVGKGACKADVQKLCPGIKPGEGRIAACIKEHRAEVSLPCKAHLKKMHPKAAANKE
jgi:hypothetical protein